MFGIAYSVVCVSIFVTFGQCDHKYTCRWKESKQKINLESVFKIISIFFAKKALLFSFKIFNLSLAYLF